MSVSASAAVRERAEMARAWQAAAVAARAGGRADGSGSASGAGAAADLSMGGGGMRMRGAHGWGAAGTRGIPGSAGAGVGGGSRGGGRAKRILICAQSNAAVDEIVVRLSKERDRGTAGGGERGIVGGKEGVPWLVRVGNENVVHSDSMPFHLDALVARELAADRRGGAQPGAAVGRGVGGEGSDENWKGREEDESGRMIEGAVGGRERVAKLRSELEHTFDVIRAVEAGRNKKEKGEDEKGDEANGQEEKGEQESWEGKRKAEGLRVNAGVSNRQRDEGARPESGTAGKKSGSWEGEAGREGGKGMTAEAIAEEILKEGDVEMSVRLNMLYRKKRQLSAELAIAQRELREAAEEDKARRLEVKRKLLRSASIVVATLNGCGGDVLSACLDLPDARLGSNSGGDSGGRNDGWAQNGGADWRGGVAGRRRIGEREERECWLDWLFDAVVIDEAAQVRGGTRCVSHDMVLIAS